MITSSPQRMNVKAMIDKLLENEWVSSDDAFALQSLLFVEDDRVGDIETLLTDLAGKLEEISGEYLRREQELMSECVMHIRDITLKTKRLDMALHEEINSAREDQHTDDLLDQLNRDA